VASVSARSLAALPEVRAGDDLAELIVAAAGGRAIGAGTLVAVAHKAVSKSEGAVVSLAGVRPSRRARELAAQTAATDGVAEKDPREIEVVLEQSAEVLRAERGVLICRTHHGFVCANAGVDASNVPGEEELVLLPKDPDGSARRIRGGLRARLGAAPAVMITDSFGRTWRHGQLDVAVGLAGMQPLDDWRGRSDSHGLQLRATWLAIADAAAACADLARAKDSREPVVLVEGLARFIVAEDGPGAAALLRAPEEDLFR
jgi:coenzyme F420-0:L-glutamate ligase / coenzyme F420-1:gamma-L-glutamate ligase